MYPRQKYIFYKANQDFQSVKSAIPLFFRHPEPKDSMIKISDLLVLFRYKEVFKKKFQLSTNIQYLILKYSILLSLQLSVLFLNCCLSLCRFSFYAMSLSVYHRLMRLNIPLVSSAALRHSASVFNNFNVHISDLQLSKRKCL